MMDLNPPANPSVFPTRAQVTGALIRAAEKARLLAEQTGTKLVISNPPSPPAQQAREATNSIAK